ncbi:MAG: GntR family transcriptional regulator [Acidimicrobiia bacterium]|nr:GntR family transcriptional regulator [Acidimicrobiia bacterium]
MKKRALQVADLIESLVCDLGWATGETVGDEAALMERFDVGRSVFRQAIRLSEHLGVAAMRRGRSGGLVITRPLPVPAALSVQISWSKQGVQKRSAERLHATIDNWAPTGPPGSKTLLDVIGWALRGFNDSSTLTPVPLDSAKRGEQLAQSIIESLMEHRWEGPELLGSESQLMARHRAGRASLREAVHLLELHGVAVMQRGPGGGLLVLRAPSPGALARSVRVQLRASGLTDHQIVTLMHEFLSAIPSEEINDPGLPMRLGAQQLINSLQVAG